MDLDTYDLIKRICFKQLIRVHHDRHLEDCTQDAVMQYLEGRTNIVWNVIEYCRKNGLSVRGKLSAKTLERSVSIDAPGASEDSENSNYLLDQESISRSEQDARLITQDDSFKGALEEFLSPLKLNIGTMKWAIQQYKVKTSLR